MPEEIRNDLILNERVRGYQSKIKIQEKMIDFLQEKIAEQEEDIQKLCESTANVGYMRATKLFCLNCKYCRYTERECICTRYNAERIFITADGVPCRHFDGKEI